ncbi:MAG: hypothetical protein HXX80_03190 [Nitrososphaerales archaeon]|nr:hypothetical protein [Nitrososphaerales archaeon]
MVERSYKDKDFIKTVEGLFFCVVGYIHPYDRVISYLRYFPSSFGKWGRASVRYARAMPSYTIPYLLKNIETLRRDFSDYIFYSDVFNTLMSAVPRYKIYEHHRPEDGLHRILKLEGPDSLQKRAIELASLISNISGISLKHIGVTGSILIDIHKPKFSDVDIVIYGRNNSLKAKEALLSYYSEEGSKVRKLYGDALNKWCEEKVRDYPLTFEEARKIYNRKWNYGLFKERNFSIHPVRLDSEIREIYGDRIYTPIGMTKIRARISDASESIFLPHTYSLQRIIVEEGKKKQDIREVTSYEGLYGGIFEHGDEILARGMLEEIIDKKAEEVYYRVLIGSLEGKGTEYMKSTDP